MSRYFVTDAPIPVREFNPDEVVSDTRPNVIYVRARMDVETAGKVSSELVSIGADGKTVEAHLGANQTALLIHNIVRWEGPDFDGVPCDAAHIRTLDPTEPHIALVLEEIAERNKRRESPNGRSPATGSTSTSAGSTGSSTPPNEAGSLSLQLATGISPLRSRITSDGRPNKSDDSTPTTLKS
jgi:hypothetical protein